MLRASGAPLPEWDYEWDYTKGLLEDNGWNVAKVSTGNASYSISGTYLKVSGNNSSYYNFSYPTQYDKCVLEAEVYMEASQNVIRINAPGTAEHQLGVRLQYSSNYKGIYLGTSTSGTKLATINYAQIYKVKLVINEGVGQAYLDDVLIGDNIDTTVDMSTQVGFFSGRGAGSTFRSNRLYSLKMKFNRI